MTSIIAPREPSAELSAVNNELVYVLHGFAGRPILMARVARYLRQNNYTVRNWGYRSIRKSVPFHAVRLRDDIAKAVDEAEWSRIHFVTHSLGGIVVRHMLSECISSVFGRIVMVAPPNSGSRLARVGSVFLRGLCPALRDISTERSSLIHSLCTSHDIEIGIIAGAGDWVVRPPSTHLPNARDYIVLRAGHLRLPLVKACAEQATHFLRHGSFH